MWFEPNIQYCHLTDAWVSAAANAELNEITRRNDNHKMKTYCCSRHIGWWWWWCCYCCCPRRWVMMEMTRIMQWQVVKTRHRHHHYQQLQQQQLKPAVHFAKPITVATSLTRNDRVLSLTVAVLNQNVAASCRNSQHRWPHAALQNPLSTAARCRYESYCSLRRDTVSTFDRQLVIRTCQRDCNDLSTVVSWTCSAVVHNWYCRSRQHGGRKLRFVEQKIFGRTIVTNEMKSAMVFLIKPTQSVHRFANNACDAREESCWLSPTGGVLACRTHSALAA